MAERTSCESGNFVTSMNVEYFNNSLIFYSIVNYAIYITISYIKNNNNEMHADGVVYIAGCSFFSCTVYRLQDTSSCSQVQGAECITNFLYVWIFCLHLACIAACIAACSAYRLHGQGLYPAHLSPESRIYLFKK